VEREWRQVKGDFLNYLLPSPSVCYYTVGLDGSPTTVIANGSEGMRCTRWRAVAAAWPTSTSTSTSDSTPAPTLEARAGMGAQTPAPATANGAMSDRLLPSVAAPTPLLFAGSTEEKISCWF
jgi:hypothetical protein